MKVGAKEKSPYPTFLHCLCLRRAAPIQHSSIAFAFAAQPLSNIPALPPPSRPHSGHDDQKRDSDENGGQRREDNKVISLEGFALIHHPLDQWVGPYSTTRWVILWGGQVATIVAGRGSTWWRWSLPALSARNKHKARGRRSFLAPSLYSSF